MNLKEWCLTWLEDVRERGNEITARCPFCGRSERNFSVNTLTLKYNCLREKCGNRGRNPLWLIAKVENISIDEAKEKYDFEISDKENIFRASEKLNAKTSDIESISIPKTAIEFGNSPQLEQRFLKYLRKRRISDQTIQDFKLKYCITGKYADRIIIPINTLNFKAFTSRTILDDPEFQIVEDPELERYKNEYGDWKSKALVGFNEFLNRKNFTQLIIVEGPFDVLNMYDLGFGVIGIQGAVIQNKQIEIIRKNIPEECNIVIMLDPEVFKQNIDDIAGKLYSHFKKIFVAKLERGIDPGSCTKRQALMALMNVEIWEGSV